MTDRKMFPRDAMALRDEIAQLLRAAVADHGRGMDTGGGLGCADLWVWVDGREYLIMVKPTGNRTVTVGLGGGGGGA